jgi:hypothetical protein
MATHEQVLEYYKTLDTWGSKFSYLFNIEIASTWDPRRWLRSYFLPKPKIKWYGPRKIDQLVNNSDCHSCNSLDIWVDVESESKIEVINYTLRLKLRPHRKKLYPVEYEHLCGDTLSTGTGGRRLICKHVHNALNFIDKEFPHVAPIGFTPNSELLEAFEQIEKERIPAKEKLIKTFRELAIRLSPEEIHYLERLNKRLKYLKKS